MTCDCKITLNLENVNHAKTLIIIHWQVVNNEIMKNVTHQSFDGNFKDYLFVGKQNEVFRSSQFKVNISNYFHWHIQDPTATYFTGPTVFSSYYSISTFLHSNFNRVYWYTTVFHFQTRVSQAQACTYACALA